MALVTTKPDVRHVWSILGTRADIDINKRLNGWTQEIPPNEIMNSIDYNQDLAVKYLFQEGIAEWDANFEFNTTSYTKYQGVIYKLKDTAEVPNRGKRPDVSPESWEVAFEPYGTSDSLRETVRRMQQEEGFLELYVSKTNPVMNGNALAPNFLAKEGGGFAFEGFNQSTGLYLNNRNEPVVQIGGVTVGSFTANEIDVQTSPPETVLTVGTFQSLMMSIQEMMFPVGNSIISSRPENPRTYLGFGTWELDLEGRALVGVSSSTSNSVPEWVKSVNSEFGEYTHKLTIEEMPSHNHKMNHSIGGFNGSNNFESGSGSPHVNNNYIQNTGGDQPHNNVQPSQTKYIWTRTA